MRLHVARFSTPKLGSAAAENEDAARLAPDDRVAGRWTGRRLRVVVADGASESMLAGRWARRLVDGFATTRSAWSAAPGFVATYAAAADGWDEAMAAYVDEREARGAPIAWYEEPGLAKGAHATLLVFELRDAGRTGVRSWRAAAVGDSCVVQVRSGEVLDAFPLGASADFTSQPPLLATQRPADELTARHVATRTGEWARGDAFFVATDALSQYLLASAEQHDGEAFAELSGLRSDGAAEFDEWVAAGRSKGLRNDDTTLVRIDVR